MSLRTSQALGLLVILGLTAAACGSRGPLDGIGEEGTTTDASVPPIPSTTSTTIPDAAPKPSGPDLPPIVDCGICLVGQCGQPILSCITNPTCQQAFQCVLTTCGGGLDPKCILGCAQSSPQGALQLLQIFQCVTGKCGADCTDILGQLGGGGGPTPPTPTTPPTPRDAGPPPRDAAPPRALPIDREGQPAQPAQPGRVALERAFSAWPELLTPAR